MHDQTYDSGRAGRLVALLRALAARIAALREDRELLDAGPELLKMMGDARSELFHYEVRVTYDAPGAAESRRIVEQARRQIESLTFDDPADQEDEPWRNG